MQIENHYACGHVETSSDPYCHEPNAINDLAFVCDLCQGGAE